MSQDQIDEKILAIIKSFLPVGLTGYPDDFFSWVKMEIKKENKDYSFVTKENVVAHLQYLKDKKELQAGKFDPKEFSPADHYTPDSKSWRSDSYTIYGAFEYSPIQYVRSRLESFLKANNVNELDLMDISIATIEGIENAAKYGDGGLVTVSISINDQKKLVISIINNIKEFDLENEIERGKYSATTTLMRGIMVMQKLFNHLDLQILEDKKQAKLYAEKVLT